MIVDPILLRLINTAVPAKGCREDLGLLWLVHTSDSCALIELCVIAFKNMAKIILWLVYEFFALAEDQEVLLMDSLN